MISTQLSDMANAVDGRLLGSNLTIESVSTDSRNIDRNGLFVALVGERFDAHNFCEQAVEQGAVALLVEKELPLPVPQLIVEDTKLALGKLGALNFAKANMPKVAITGSCGKTTVKEMLASILSLRGEVLATAGNFNNDIGAPLTLLRATEQHDFSVIELGANHEHEIEYTVNLVQPDIALVNNVAAAHLEGFGSMQGVMKAKGEIFSTLDEGGLALYNLESQGGELWQALLENKRVQTFSLDNSLAEYYAGNIAIDSNGLASFHLHTPFGMAEVKLGVVGRHNVANAVATAAIALNLGTDLPTVVRGLESVAQVKGRVAVEQLTDKIRLIDDSYNASVPAMKAAADLLGSFEGSRWLILGFMAELGKESLELHRQVGEYAAKFGFEHVLTYGADTKVISDVTHGRHFEDHQSLMAFIEQQLSTQPHTQHTLLVKGANSAQMSKIAAALKEKLK
ncbi:UDP-N-acetylmuramoyl-tripeptide--D-alanyl-D-alanine ligase [Vibrio breoganii]|uniref:UDP-N-acetylmuramoyl-tripeptide--D-alanyl-D-alanine ligase n=1 Tax=Vibrio breoganii TaxID=553239 RepID=A0AAP8N164_9VIBR|nr:UDP-N-acetylmuramoyl-tripeptide--D-alanyl-D-alanine ligase [Vibrio breoganii]NMO72558.1 UDP-N-acetylmuramoyl-tripeptide--D-alanyl-D-alanine ligase [Vibrio breoganii]NMR69208.1 UDP-N-acetylmuramoyl-tripeptide--D-alanyl-D-alanine ligase [Vibrio breoganii]PMF91608.1 UDP-N-acetylmuramoyl-tripeptide--D-alanyl-D-alanine ligase [Vibrio breoganii]PMG03393.1 UDP-N-acetylmuramoyl-tripeptide--D-alanyl-D-alanine ligase [Vibrio breoganii]PMG38486.1 UDP-N-acetylmuramoyl-tripeptide--D-alanyl-D-alanine lig